MSFGMGHGGFPAISMTQHAANKFAEVAERADRRALPGCRPKPSGIQRAAPAPRPASRPESSTPLAWFAKNSALPAYPRGTYHKVGDQEAQRLGPVRHARQRHGVDAGSVRALHGGTGGQPVGEVCRGRIPMPSAAGRGTIPTHAWDARSAWPPIRRGRSRIPQLPKSIWYMTDAQWLGFRLVRPVRPCRPSKRCTARGTTASSRIPSRQCPRSSRPDAPRPSLSSSRRGPGCSASKPSNLTWARSSGSPCMHRASRRPARRFARVSIASASWTAFFPTTSPTASSIRSPGPPSGGPCASATICSPSCARRRSSAFATNGAFDITQGPVVRLWREARKSGRMPDHAALEEASGRTGFRKLHLDGERRTVTLEIAGMALDVGAIGKGTPPARPSRCSASAVSGARWWQ